MDPSLFRYVWRHSRRDQLIILGVVLLSLPFYFLSLDLPRRIVNEAIQGRAFDGGQSTAPFLVMHFELPGWLGGGALRLFDGFEVDRYGLLFGLSGIFLLLVLINGGFKYVVNVAKGALGERMLRRLRYDLFSLILRFNPEALRNVKAAEAATIVKDEVEPIGGFIGDAFILPAFLGLQAITALVFIMVQSFWLGMVAFAMIAVQFTIIPRLRRELLRLGRERQLASRRLAGRISEVLDGMELVQVHGAAPWERAEIGHRLYTLFDLRFRIYRRKFMVKFLNNLLAQLTPFFFYAVGGYFALRGDLSIGQLVAVIAAYRELPPPLKELIDWDQQRLDVQVKYDQVVQFFAPDRLLPVEEAGEPDVPLNGPLVIEDLTVRDSHGGAVIRPSSLHLDGPSRVALVGDGGPAASTLAQILGRRGIQYRGTVTVSGRDLARLAPSVAGRRLAYVGSEPILFPGSLRDNLVYGLRRRPVVRAREDPRVAARRLAEAMRTGNPADFIEDEWIDFEELGLGHPDALDKRLIELMVRLGQDEDLYRFGLSGAIDLARYPHLEERIIAARARLRSKLEADGLSHLIEPFDAGNYNSQATVGENLLFGVPYDKALAGRALAAHRDVRAALAASGLEGVLVEIGSRIAETMTEIFRGLPPGHPLFEQFSFLSADEMPEFEAILHRKASRGGCTREDRTKLLALSLFYVEPRHRLGLIDPPIQARLVAARADIRAALARRPTLAVAFYDPAHVCPPAPLKDNLLFGRVNYSVADAQSRVMSLVAAVVEEMDMRADVERIGLDHQVGPSGRLLSAQQRAAVSLARSLVKEPDILIVDGALQVFGDARARALTLMLLRAFEGRFLFVVVPNRAQAQGFDGLVRFPDGRAELEKREAVLPSATPSDQDDAPAGGVQPRIAAGE